jgi:hypothetical protein
MIFFSIAGLIDLLLLATLPFLFNAIVASKNINFIILIFILFILRTIVVYALKKCSVKSLFYKKNIAENKIIENYVSNAHANFTSETKKIGLVKEKILNSSQIAYVNFDLPILSLLSELTIAIGSLFILMNLLSLKLVFLTTITLIPIVFLIRYLSKKLKLFGFQMIQLADERIRKLDNVIESSYELNISNNLNYKEYFNQTNHMFNSIIARQTSTNIGIQIIFETFSFILIGMIIIYSVFGSNPEFNIINTTSALAVLLRAIPTITRTVASITQLNYGIPAIIQINEYEK